VCAKHSILTTKQAIQLGAKKTHCLHIIQQDFVGFVWRECFRGPPIESARDLNLLESADQRYCISNHESSRFLLACVSTVILPHTK
jgi:hypothetical protein